MRRIIRLLATSAAVTAGTVVATAAAASADVGVGAEVHFVPLGSLLFSDRNLKRDIVPVQWDR
ncbi:hypothetical protein ACQP25_01790 [Microtetraspora malaysiensis]|uniref:hypothetical protein n=1 Tax=Microtetraspora malaysiensis TaxID=161358 RepID=UPI003D8A4957